MSAVVSLADYHGNVMGFECVEKDAVILKIFQNSKILLELKEKKCMNADF